MNQSILQEGSVEVRVRVAGIWQRHKLTLEYETTAFGRVPYLVTRANIPFAELLRVANELDMPLKAPAGVVFPQGKAPKDFTLSES